MLKECEATMRQAKRAAGAKELAEVQKYGSDKTWCSCWTFGVTMKTELLSQYKVKFKIDEWFILKLNLLEFIIASDDPSFDVELGEEPVDEEQM